MTPPAMIMQQRDDSGFSGKMKTAALRAAPADILVAGWFVTPPQNCHSEGNFLCAGKILLVEVLPVLKKVLSE